MTHVTQLGLWGLWQGLTGPAIAASWPRGASNGWPCGWDEWRDNSLAGGSIVWAEDLAHELPTCPRCAVLCDMARGAE